MESMNLLLNSLNDFSETMNNVRWFLGHETENDSKIRIIDFVMEVVREDLKTDLLSSILYRRRHDAKWINPLMPSNFYDEVGNKIMLQDSQTQGSAVKEVDLSVDCILAVPWHFISYVDAIRTIGTNEFVNDSNHRACYFKELELSCVNGGNHSIGAGVVYKKGRVKAKEISIKEMFPHVYTNGFHWFNQHTKEKLAKVLDFRISLLYELAKMKEELLRVNLVNQ